MQAMKRPAAIFAATSGKRGRPGKKDSTERQQASIADALETAQLSAGARDLLLSVLPVALLPQPRHNFQEEAVQMLERELMAVKESFEARITEIQADLADAGAKRTNLQATADEAHASLDAKSTAANEAKEKLDEASAQLREATAAQSGEELSKSELFDSIGSAAEKAELLKQTKVLKVRILGGDDKASVDVLDSNLRILVHDLNLLDAVRKCLNKNPGDRSQFEELVLQQLDHQLVTLEKQLIALQNEGTAQKADAEERVNTASAKAEVCLQAKMSCNQAFTDATDAKKEADKAAKVAKTYLKAFEASMPGMQKKLDAVHSKLTIFTSGALINFLKLKESKAEPAEEEKKDLQSQPETTENCKIAEDVDETTLPVAPTEAA